MIDRMTLAEAGEILGYWAEAPPAHLLLQAIARLLGWAPAPATEPAAFDDIDAAAPPGLAVVRGADNAMPPPVLDPAILRQRNRARTAKNSPSPASLRSAPSPSGIVPHAASSAGGEKPSQKNGDYPGFSGCPC